MVIVAGYEKDLNECFFSANPGLNSRFTWRFKNDDYTAGTTRENIRKKSARLPADKRRLTRADLEKGMTMFISNEEVKQRKDVKSLASASMHL